jgi:hypothetical protein
VWFKASKKEKLRLKVRQDYEHAKELSESLNRDDRVFCVRIALKCRANIDSAFVRAAKELELYDQQATLAVAKGIEAPKSPSADAYQLVKTGSEYVLTYIPENFAEKIFALGGAYQTLKISRKQAIEKVQLIADEIWNELGISESFEVMRFLRDEENESSQGSISEDDND